MDLAHSGIASAHHIELAGVGGANSDVNPVFSAQLTASVGLDTNCMKSYLKGQKRAAY